MPSKRPATKAEPKKALTPAALETALKKRFGAGAVRRASDPSLRITRIPCGVLSVDDALGGGFARGRHTEIFGQFSVGKTYLTYRLIANAQKLGLRCAFYDAEHGFDPVFAESAGVVLKDLALPEFKTANELVNIMEAHLRSQLYDVMVLDSIASLLPKKELESDMDAGNYGTAQAMLMSQALRRLTAANNSTVLVYINQLREAVGVMFGNKWITSGGRAMGFYAGTRIELVQTETITKTVKTVNHKTGKESLEKIKKGHRVLVKIQKDKTGGATTGDSTTFVYDYDKSSIDPVEDLLYLGRVKGLIGVNGDKWWMVGYEDESAHGRPKFKSWLKKNKIPRKELQAALRSQVYEDA